MVQDFCHDLGPFDVAAGATEEVLVRLGWRSVDVYLVVARELFEEFVDEAGAN